MLYADDVSLTQISAEEVEAALPSRFSKAGKEARQDLFLEMLVTGESQRHVMEHLGLTESTLHEWKREPSFRDRHREVWARRRLKIEDTKTVMFDPFREFPPTTDLVTFRTEVFGFPSTPTQQDFGKAYDDKTNLVIFWVAAAGAGKDVTSMQAVAHAAASGQDLMGCIMEN